LLVGQRRCVGVKPALQGRQLIVVFCFYPFRFIVAPHDNHAVDVDVADVILIECQENIDVIIGGSRNLGIHVQFTRRIHEIVPQIPIILDVLDLIDLRLIIVILRDTLKVDDVFATVCENKVITPFVAEVVRVILSVPDQQIIARAAGQTLDTD